MKFIACKRLTSPAQMPAGRIPVSLKSQVKEEFSDLMKRGMLQPVSEPTEWCSQISVQVKKNGQLRICIDPKFLNDGLQRKRYPLPVIDDILPELNKARVFSKVDLRSGYWHCLLDQESSVLTTCITPFGRCRWTTLPFGSKASAEIFQRKL